MIVDFITKIVLAGAVAYFTYMLGLRTYFRQREYENTRKRYIDEGLEVVCAQIDYALGVHRHNWQLLARTIGHYSSSKEEIQINEFLESLSEIDQARMQMGPMYRVVRLLQNNLPWTLYQQLFVLVGSSVHDIKTRFGIPLKSGREGQSGGASDEEKIIEAGNQIADRMKSEIEPYSDLLTSLQELASCLETTKLNRAALKKFSESAEARMAVGKLEKAADSILGGRTEIIS